MHLQRATSLRARSPRRAPFFPTSRAAKSVKLIRSWCYATPWQGVPCKGLLPACISEAASEAGEGAHTWRSVIIPKAFEGSVNNHGQEGFVHDGFSRTVNTDSPIAGHGVCIKVCHEGTRCESCNLT